MRLAVKPKNSNNLDLYIKRGAEAFLFGIEGFSLLGAGIISLEELKRIRETYKDIEIFVRVDKNFFNQELDDLKELLINLNNLKINGLFFYDLGVLNICLEQKTAFLLIQNQNYMITNARTIDYYKNLGVQGAVITTEMTKEEICNLFDYTKFMSFLNVFGYQMMALSKRKLLSNYYEFINEEKEKDVFLIENNIEYRTVETEDGTMFFSPFILNGLRYLKNFNKIDYLILDSIFLEEELFLKVLEIYKKSVSGNFSYAVLKLLEKENKELFSNTSLGLFDKKVVFKVKSHE